jgi:hypothetical protein
MNARVMDRRGIAVRWAADTPRVRRLWLLDDGRYGIDIEPVADSEETLTLWIAHAEGWREELAERLGSPCAIEWIDPDRDAPAPEASGLLYERAAA